MHRGCLLSTSVLCSDEWKYVRPRLLKHDLRNLFTRINRTLMNVKLCRLMRRPRSRPVSLHASAPRPATPRHAVQFYYHVYAVVAMFISHVGLLPAALSPGHVAPPPTHALRLSLRSNYLEVVARLRGSSAAGYEVSSAILRLNVLR